MRLLEDILSPSDRIAIDALIASKEVRFDLLVEIAGLDPKFDFRFANLKWVDFCRADLRGFDFTGADLRFSCRDSATIIDASTILDDALIEWIEKEAIPIVQQMMLAQNAGSSEERRRLLGELVSNFGRSDHVVQYLLKAVETSKSMEEIIDFASQIPSDISRSQIMRFKSAAKESLRKRTKRGQSRTRRAGTANLAVEPLIDRLKDSGDSLAAQIFENLTGIVAGAGRVPMTGYALPTMKDIEDAISKL
jgi:Uncharacterized low-complexity proteins